MPPKDEAKIVAKPNPSFDPTGKYEEQDVVRVKALAGSPTRMDGTPIHKEGEEYETHGATATIIIRKGYAEFVEKVRERNIYNAEVKKKKPATK